MVIKTAGKEIRVACYKVVAQVAAASLCALYSVAPALAQSIIGADDFAGGASNPSGVVNAATIDTSLYTSLSEDPFETYSSVSLPAPQSGQTYLGRVQWAVDGQTDKEPFYSTATLNHTEFYVEYEYYVPTGFPECGSKWMRGGRQESDVFIGNAFFIESSPESESLSTSGSWTMQLLLFEYDDEGALIDEQSDTTTATVRDAWQRIGFWGKYNTFDGETANADGFARLYFDRVLVANIENVTWSPDSAHASGFDGVKFPLNHSYTACGGVEVDDAIHIAGVTVYDTFPDSSSSSSSSSSSGGSNSYGGSFAGVYY